MVALLWCFFIMDRFLGALFLFYNYLFLLIFIFLKRVDSRLLLPIDAIMRPKVKTL